MEDLVAVEEGAEAFVELLNANGVDYIFLNPGTELVPIQEALSKFKALAKRTPEVVLCLHESVAMAAAHGYFMVSGRPQVVLVHEDVGTQQVGGALHNAQRGRIAVIFCAGLAPSILSEGKRGGRTVRRDWLQDTFDQTGIVRNYVKWDYMLRSTENISEVVQRAFQVATTEPCGPVYLSLPREVLMEKMDGVRIPSTTRHAAPATPQADTALLAEAAEMLVHAEQPLIITGYSGRYPESVAPLVELAETLGARVVTGELRMNFPLRHPLCAGVDATKGGVNPEYLKDADVILVIDHDTPYFPSPTGPRPDARIIHIDIDPVKQDLPLWGFPTDILLEADSRKAIPVLNEIIQSKLTPELRVRFLERAKQIEEEHEELRAKWHSLAMGKAKQKPISAEWLSHCIDRVVDEDAIILNETVTNMPSVARQISRTQPGTMFAKAGSNLGWGLGAALGAKLAAPDKTVVSLVGDGGFVFGCPIPTLWAAKVNNAPFLTIIFNNQQYNAIKQAIWNLYGQDGFSAKTGVWIGMEITPSPDYALIAVACQGYGTIVEDPSEVTPALREALEQVRAGKPAVLDIRLSPSQERHR